MAFGPEALWGALGAPSGAGWAVAYSGGHDSTVLLHAMTALRPRLGPARLRALHVDHGLAAESGDWARACRETCTRLGVACEVMVVDAGAASGESPEAAAREARYAALAGALLPGEVLLTAHHADDQLETVFLQLLRGAGVAGLAAMPRDVALGPGRHRRPLLDFTRAELACWAEEQGLRFVDDPANREPRYARSYFRQRVLPRLLAYWPAAASSVARTAELCAETARLLAEVGRADADACRDADGLAVAALAALSPERQRNAVRHEALRLGLPLPDRRRTEELLRQAMAAAPDATPLVRWPGAAAFRHRGRLRLVAGSALEVPEGEREWPDPLRPLDLGAGLGRLSLEWTMLGGLDPQALGELPWRVAWRSGGERIRLPGGRHRRPLKKLLNEAGVASWLRSRIPLVEIGGSLAAVGSRWVASEWWTPPGNKALRIRWQERDASG